MANFFTFVQDINKGLGLLWFHGIIIGLIASLLFIVLTLFVLFGFVIGESSLFSCTSSFTYYVMEFVLLFIYIACHVMPITY
jgi:hypothetical protein